MPPFYERTAFYLYLLTLLPFALCLYFYGTRSPWRREPIGRAVIALLASLVAVLGWAVLVQITEIPAAILDVMRALLLGSVALSGWVLLRNILTLQRDRSTQEPPPESGA